MTDIREFLKALPKPPRIVRNSIRCRRCGDEIESTHRHDFRWCSCGSVAVDGGREYQRVVGDRADWESTSILEERE